MAWIQDKHAERFAVYKAMAEMFHLKLLNVCVLFFYYTSSFGIATTYLNLYRNTPIIVYIPVFYKVYKY